AGGAARTQGRDEPRLVPYRCTTPLSLHNVDDVPPCLQEAVQRVASRHVVLGVGGGVVDEDQALAVLLGQTGDHEQVAGGVGHDGARQRVVLGGANRCDHGHATCRVVLHVFERVAACDPVGD